MTHLLPGESHPLKVLLPVLRAVAAQELIKVVTFQVAGLVAMDLSCTHKYTRTHACTHTLI